MDHSFLIQSSVEGHLAEPKLLIGTQAVCPCFIGTLGMWASSLKILFIYLFMWQRANQEEREHKQGSGSGRSRLQVEKPDEGLLSGTL